MKQSRREFFISLYWELQRLFLPIFRERNVDHLPSESSTTGNDQFNIPKTRSDDQMLCSQLCRYTRIDLGIVNGIFKKPLWTCKKSRTKDRPYTVLISTTWYYSTVYWLSTQPENYPNYVTINSFQAFRRVFFSERTNMAWFPISFAKQKFSKMPGCKKKILYHNMDVYLMFSFHILSLEHQTYQSWRVFAKVHPPCHLK